MKMRLTFILVCLAAMNAWGQTSLAERYARVMRSEVTMSADSLEMLGKELTAEGLAGAAQQLILVTGKPMPSVQQDIFLLKNYSLDSIASRFDYTISNEWIAKAKGIKKTPLKNAFIDSVFNAQSDIASYPQTYFLLSKNPFAIKKWKGPLLNKIEEISTNKNAVESLKNYAALHQAAKWIKDAKAMSIIKEKVNSLLLSFSQKELSFFYETVRTPVVKEIKQPVVAPDSSIKAADNSLFLSLIIGISILTILFLALFLMKNHQLNKTQHELVNFQHKESKSRDELSERENAIAQTNRDLIIENKRLLDEIKKQQSSINHFEDQIDVFNSELKSAIDNLSREHSIQHALEANNVLSRNMAKMRELLNSQKKA